MRISDWSSDVCSSDLANRFPPELATFDLHGRRIDEVRFHPAYHALMRLATEHRIHDIAWAHEGNGGHVAHAALLALFTQAEAEIGRASVRERVCRSV